MRLEIKNDNIVKIKPITILYVTYLQRRIYIPSFSQTSLPPCLVSSGKMERQIYATNKSQLVFTKLYPYLDWIGDILQRTKD